MLFATAEFRMIGVVVAEVVAPCGLASAFRIARVDEGVRRFDTSVGEEIVDAPVVLLVPDVGDVADVPVVPCVEAVLAGVDAAEDDCCCCIHAPLLHPY